MNDLLLVVATFAGTYLCSMAFVIALTRLIFPFRTKQEMAEAFIERIATQQRNVPKQTRIVLPLVHSHSNLTLDR